MGPGGCCMADGRVTVAPWTSAMYCATCRGLMHPKAACRCWWLHVAATDSLLSTQRCMPRVVQSHAVWPCTQKACWRLPVAAAS